MKSMPWIRAQRGVHSQSGAVDDLKIRSVRDGDRHVMALVGSLDRTTAEQLEDELKRVEATDTAEILVDLSELQFIDAAGMNVFIHARTRSHSHAKRLSMLPGPDRVHRSFEISGLLPRLPFIDHEDATPLRN